MWPFRRKPAGDGPPEGVEWKEQHVLSILSPEEVSSLGGLPGEAIAGVPEGGRDSVEAFRPNRAFIELMHQVIRDTGPQDPDLRAAAALQRDGWVYIVDLRTPEGPQGHVPPEDIIGAFEVRSGQIVPGSYQLNENHPVLTGNGLVQLPPFLRKAFVRELVRARSRGGSKGDA